MISYLLPTHNRPHALWQTLAALGALSCDEHDVVGGAEVIVVDNGSTDRSAERAAQAGARVIHEPIPGYGSALIRGFDEASGEFLIMGDCDDTYDFSNLDGLLSPLHQGYDLGIGDRYLGGIRPGARPWSASARPV